MVFSQLVGRGVELTWILDALARGDRFLTIKGMAGMGKTHLASVAARKAVDEGIVDRWFLSELTFATSAENVWEALVVAADATDRAAFVRRLNETESPLVVLDGVARDAVASVIVELLDAIPNVRILVTSRVTLDVPGETILDLPPLSLPSPTQRESDAERLFVTLATRRNPSFIVSDRNSLEQLLTALSGIPLAIELAARRAAVLGVDATLEQLRAGMDVLSRPGVSLVRVLDASFAALSEDERNVLFDCAVCRSGFTLEAATAIARSRLPLVDTLHSLSEKSLLYVDPRRQRFGMHEVIREHARTAFPPRSDAIRRHKEHYATWVYGLHEVFGPIPAASERSAIMAEIDNVRVATEEALANGDAVLAAQALAATGPTLRIHGNVSWWLDARERLRPRSDIPVEIFARLELATAEMAIKTVWQNEGEDLALSVAAMPASPNVRVAAAIICAQARLARGASAEAEEALRAVSNLSVVEVLDIERSIIALSAEPTVTPRIRGQIDDLILRSNQTKDIALIAVSLRTAGLFDLVSGNPASARGYFERVLTLAQAHDLEPLSIAMSQSLGQCALDEGDLDMATRHLEEALSRYATSGPGYLPRSRYFLGLTLFERGDSAAALDAFERCEVEFSAVKTDEPAALSIGACSLILAKNGQSARASAVLDRASAKGSSEIASATLALLRWSITLLGGPAASRPPPREIPAALRSASLLGQMAYATARVIVRRFEPDMAPVIHTDRDFTFVSANGLRIDLGRRATLRKLLQALAEANGTLVDQSTLIAALWPGDVDPSAKNRLRVAVAALRKLGLAEAIETEGTAYRLSYVVRYH